MKYIIPIAFLIAAGFILYNNLKKPLETVDTTSTIGHTIPKSNINGKVEFTQPSMTYGMTSSTLNVPTGSNIIGMVYSNGFIKVKCADGRVIEMAMNNSSNTGMVC